MNKVSFPPLEMAKVRTEFALRRRILIIFQAFESPMLAECNSNSSGRDLAEAAGAAKVRYGAIRTDQKSDKTKLCFGDPEDIVPPENGMRFDI